MGNSSSSTDKSETYSIGITIEQSQARGNLVLMQNGAIEEFTSSSNEVKKDLDLTYDNAIYKDGVVYYLPAQKSNAKATFTLDKIPIGICLMFVTKK